MKMHSVAAIICLIATFLFSNELFSQTCRVHAGKQQNGCVTYREVFEFDYVDTKPEFPGGGQNLINFINQNRHYPQEAYLNGIEGRVTCSFIVNPDGKVSNISVLRGVENSLNQEAVRLISIMPDWTPGKMDSINVPVRVIYCIPFRR